LTDWQWPREEERMQIGTVTVDTNSDFVTVQDGMYVNRPLRCNEYNG